MDDFEDNVGFPATFETAIDAAGVLTLKVVGELDIANVTPIRQALVAVVAEKPSRVVIDLSELSFLDSSGLALFMFLANEVGDVELREASPIVGRIIDVTGLSSVFKMTP